MPAPRETALSDYERVARAIEFLAMRADSQPALADVAAHVHLSPYHFQRLFGRWAGVTPKRFLQALTLERAKRLLGRNGAPALAVADSLGLSSGSRLHDHFVKLDAMTPNEYRNRGAGLTIEYGLAESPFGKVFVATTTRGLCKLAFTDDDGETDLAALETDWPRAKLAADSRHAARVSADVFDLTPDAPRTLSLLVRGTNFQIAVWRALLAIAPGRLASYAEIARIAGRPDAARAAGAAIGANPVAFVIPCHRVIRQSGALGGYRWGTTRKLAIQAWERVQLEAPSTLV